MKYIFVLYKYLRIVFIPYKWGPRGVENYTTG